MSLAGKKVLITGAARRVGRALAMAAAQAGADILLHYGQSSQEAAETQAELAELGVQVQVFQADLSLAGEILHLAGQAFAPGPVYALVNSAAVFEPLDWETTGLEAWDRHLRINLTAPFLLSQAFARHLPPHGTGRIVNILDWRALRPGPDHLPYTVSKAGLAALTRSLAAALAPRIQVNGLAFGAILPPSDGAAAAGILAAVPAGRWAEPEEVGQALRFLLEGPEYITGEILHLDGGRHLT